MVDFQELFTSSQTMISLSHEKVSVSVWNMPVSPDSKSRLPKRRKKTWMWFSGPCQPFGFFGLTIVKDVHLWLNAAEYTTAWQYLDLKIIGTPSCPYLGGPPSAATEPAKTAMRHRDVLGPAAMMMLGPAPQADRRPLHKKQVPQQGSQEPLQSS